jgi:hypothetical protein
MKKEQIYTSGEFVDKSFFAIVELIVGKQIDFKMLS